MLQLSRTHLAIVVVAASAACQPQENTPGTRSFGIAWAILVESALSFLGMGVPEPHASRGSLLYKSRSSEGWWLTLFPGLAIFLTVTAWNLFGEGLRDAIDPRLKQ